MKTICFDLEANGYLHKADTIHCGAYAFDYGHGFGEVLLEGGQGIGRLFNRIEEADILVGHNITGYDLPLIDKLYGPDRFDWSKKQIFDTFLGSCLIQPDSTWGHSIEAWGKKHGYPEEKVQITDWSKYTDEMGRRCVVDVGINLGVYRDLKQTWLALEPQVMLIESIIAMIHARQEMYGVWFNKTLAREIYNELTQKIRQIRDSVTAEIPPAIVQKGKTIENPFTKAGKLAARVTSHFSDLSEEVLDSVAGPFSKLEYKHFNLDSHPQVKEYLLSVGWKPTEWNFNASGRTSPKLTEDSYESLPAGLGKMIADYYVMQHRRRYLLNNKNPDKPKGAITTVREDGRIPAKAMTCATPTSRYRHMETVCNTPKPSTPWGTEIRTCFGVPDGSLQIGIDLSGIEARMMCHYAMPYPGGPELAELVLHGDYHQHNADNWFSEEERDAMMDGKDRDLAKGGLYALIYGCGEAKLASQLGKPKGSGGKLFDIFWNGNPALKSLIDDVNAVYDTGRDLMGIDRRRYSVRQKRMALNTLFQGGAAAVFKHWMRLCDEWIRNEWNPVHPDAQIHQMVAYHDELQFEITTEDRKLAEQAAIRLAGLAEKAGEILKIKVPIAAEYKIGKNWAECH